jgi:aspartate/methionine/tyrosine aminotransferase
MMRLAQRNSRIEPFYVMEIAKAAQALAQQDKESAKPMLYLNIGEPDFTVPPLVQQAAIRAIQSGHTQYTEATGLRALREHISLWYATRFGLHITPDRIILTAGASGALQLACMALVQAGDSVLMADPGYPCNRHFVCAAEGQPLLLPCGPEQRYQPTPEQVARHWQADTRGVFLASPSNPTGTSISSEALRGIHKEAQSRGGFTLVDEIYLGLSYGPAFGASALQLGDDVICVNSFSKYFHMTGWRLGWLVVPPALVSVVERLAQNLYICPSVVAQKAALACFEPESLAIYEERRSAFEARRDYFVPALNQLGLQVPVMPDGAFYAWADCTQACQRLGVANSWDLAFALMEQARVAVAPGRDFGHAQTLNCLRFSTATGMPQLQEAIARLRAVLG